VTDSLPSSPDPSSPSGTVDAARDETIRTDAYDVIVIGAGHNGLICAAYLARSGARVLLVEARDRVGGTAASESFGSATVNICNCDHLTLRTTPIIDELSLADHGLRYLDVEPSQINISWTSGGHWDLSHDVDRTIEGLAHTHPGEVDGYQRYVKAARPIAELVLRAAADVPTRRALARTAVRQRLAGVPNLLRWSRRSASDILRSFFSHEALSATAAVTGPMVWGISPEFPGTGLGALTHAIRHVGRVGRPIGGSGAVTEAVREAFEAAGGHLRTSTMVDRIICDSRAVRGVGLRGGEVIEAPVVISACDPRRTLVEWIHRAPPQAAGLVERWRTRTPQDGYESKIDAIITAVPRLRTTGRAPGPTTVVAPDLADIDRAYTLMLEGRTLKHPAFLINIPTIDDATMRTPEGHHVLSIEALFTPYHFHEPWAGSSEPERWLTLASELFEEPLTNDIVTWRAVTPDRYETDFHLPAGHATSFAGGPLAVFTARDPELTSYETTIPGLFLTGAATFPGAGVWGASGRNCATVVLQSDLLGT
jgi:beta-carotene ketolase (CrtO type)